MAIFDDMIQLYNTKNILRRNNHGEENIEMYKRSYKNYHEMKKKIKCLIRIHCHRLRIVNQLIQYTIYSQRKAANHVNESKSHSDGINVSYDNIRQQCKYHKNWN